MLWECDACTTRYAESLQACPHCGATERHEAGAEEPTGPADEDEAGQTQ